MVAIIGLGRSGCGDDAAGGEVVRALHGRLPADLRLVETTGDGLALLDAWSGCEQAIVVDAMQSGRTPGEVCRWHGRALPPEASLSRGSTHSMSFVETLRLAAALEQLPKRLEVIGIEGLKFQPGDAITPAVASAVLAVADSLAKEFSCTSLG